MCGPDVKLYSVDTNSKTLPSESQSVKVMRKIVGQDGIPPEAPKARAKTMEDLADKAQVVNVEDLPHFMAQRSNRELESVRLGLKLSEALKSENREKLINVARAVQGANSGVVTGKILELAQQVETSLREGGENLDNLVRDVTVTLDMADVKNLQAMTEGKEPDSARTTAEVEASLNRLTSGLDEPVFPKGLNIPDDVKAVLEPLVMAARGYAIMNENLLLASRVEMDRLNAKLDEVSRAPTLEAKTALLAEVQTSIQASRGATGYLLAHELEEVTTRFYAVTGGVLFEMVPEAYLGLESSLPNVDGDITRISQPMFTRVAEAVLSRADLNLSPVALFKSLLKGAESLGKTPLFQLDVLCLAMNALKPIDEQIAQEVSEAAPGVVINEAERHKTLRREALGMVDMLFQNAYPEGEADALTVKSAFLSLEDQQAVNVQHSLQLLHRAVAGFLVGDPQKYHIASQLYTNSARSFLITTDLVQSLRENSGLPVDQMNLLTAQFVILQAKAADLGVIDVSSLMKRAERDGAPAEAKRIVQVTQKELDARWQVVGDEQVNEARAGAPAARNPNELPEPQAPAAQPNPAEVAPNPPVGNPQEVPPLNPPAGGQPQNPQEAQAPAGGEEPLGDDWVVLGENTENQLYLIKDPVRWCQVLGLPPDICELAGKAYAEIEEAQPEQPPINPVVVGNPGEDNGVVAAGIPQGQDVPAENGVAPAGGEHNDLVEGNLNANNVPEPPQNPPAPEGLGFAQVQANPMDLLTSAARGFAMGLTGTRKLEDTKNVLQRSVDIMKKGKLRYDFLKNSPMFLAKVGLQHLVADVAGLVDANERLVDRNGLTVNGENVKRAMKARVDLIMQQIRGNEELAQKQRQALTYGYAIATGIGLQQAHEAALGSDNILKQIARLEHTVQTEAKTVVTLSDTLERMKNNLEEFNLKLRFAFASTKLARLENARRVTTFAAKMQALKEPGKTPEELAAIRLELDQIRGSLQGIDPLTLRFDSKHPQEIPSDESILQLMLPRAQTIEYFERKDFQGHLGISKADQDAQLIKTASKRYKPALKEREALVKQLSSQLSKESLGELEAIVKAAMLTVAVENGSTLEATKFNDPAVTRKFWHQLDEWGIKQRNLVLRPLVMKYARSILGADCAIDPEAVKTLYKDRKFHFASGKAASEQFLAQHPADGKKALEETIRPTEALAKESAAGLMSLLTQPGMSFTLSRERGVSVAMGEFYTPWRRAGATYIGNSVQNLMFQTRVSLDYLEQDGIAVTKTGADTYEVFLKNGSQLGATVSQSFLKGSLMLSVGGKVSQAMGTVFTFTDPAKCEEFLKLITTEKPSLTSQEVHKAVGGASQIRLVSEEGAALDVSFGVFLSPEILKHQYDPYELAWGIEEQPTVGVGVSFVAAGKAAIKTSTQRNAFGEVHTSHVEGSINLTFTASADVLSLAKLPIDGPTALTQVKKKTKQPVFQLKGAFATSHDRKLVTGQHGISPATSVTTSTTVSAGVTLLGEFSKNFERYLFLPQELEAIKQRSPLARSQIEMLFRNLQPGEKVSVVRSITSEALERANKLQAKARAAETEADRLAILDELNALLADNSNYVPTKITVTKASTKQLTVWSPGFLCVAWNRHDTFSVKKTTNSVEINMG